MKTLNFKYFALPIIAFFIHCGGSTTQSDQWLNTGVKGLVAPSEIFVSCVASHEIHVTWDQFTTTGTDLMVERSVNGAEFESIGEPLDVDSNLDGYTFSDTDITYGLAYQYRVRTVVASDTAGINYVSNYATSGNISPDGVTCTGGIIIDQNDEANAVN